MYKNLISKKNLICGDTNLIRESNIIFDPLVVDFLDQLSKKIFNIKDNSSLVDLVSFAFWCRKKNLLLLKKNYKNSLSNSVGRGIIFHITPSNVPLNCIYSLAFGLLSGNSNIVRIPSKNFKQLKKITHEISLLLKKKNFFKLKKRISMIRYESSEPISEKISKCVDARIIWGGDETINKFKKFLTQPRCIDLFFADRHSLSIINTNKLNELNNSDLINLCNKFYNDTFTMDQLGCSSPHVVLWHGNNHKLKEKFWVILNDIVSSNYIYDLSLANKKIKNLSSLALNNEFNFKTSLSNLKVLRLKKVNLSNKLAEFKNSYGTFFDINIKHIGDLKKIISKKTQTLTYYGYNEKQLLEIIKRKKFIGIDRIVPIGRAFDIGPIWDGYDIISFLSRKIAT